MSGLFGKNNGVQNIERLQELSTQTRNIIGALTKYLLDCERGQYEQVTGVLRKVTATDTQLNAAHTQREKTLGLNSTSAGSQEEESKQSTEAPTPKS